MLPASRVGGLTIAELEGRAREMEKRATEIRKLLKKLRRVAGVDIEAAFSVAAPAGPRRGPGRPRGRGAAAAALAILREKGRPMRAGELLPLIEKRGVAVGGKNPKATLASTLLKHDEIGKAGRGLFVPKENEAKGAAAPAPKPAKRGRPKKKATRKKVARKKTAKKKKSAAKG
jgi:hypothetical protein